MKSPEVEGYEVDIDRVRGTLTADTEVDVHYKQLTYVLVIQYRYGDGTIAAPAYVNEEMHFEDTYNVNSPTIEGFTPSRQTVRGKMPARNVTITVIYTDNTPGDDIITIEDFETPLGLGLGGTNAGETIE